MKIEFNAKKTTQAITGVLDYHQLMEPIIETVTGSSDPMGREVVEKKIEKAIWNIPDWEFTPLGIEAMNQIDQEWRARVWKKIVTIR